jgi:hypothetical protein
MRCYFLIFFILLLRINSLSQHSPISLSPNYRIYPSDIDQTEVFIAKSPADESILFVSCNTISFIPFFVSEGVYATTDGGQSWHGSDTCGGDPIGFHGGEPGITIDRNGTFILTRIGRSPFKGLFSHYSNDNGITWSTQKAISTDDLERATLGTDAVKASPYYGRSYAVWVRFAPPFPLTIACTDDGAQSWSTPAAINNPPNRSAGGDVAIGPEGQVYTCWAGVTETAPFKEIYAGFAASSDGGQSWTVSEEAFTMSGITGVLQNKSNIRVNGLPNIAADTTHGPYRGSIYIVTGEKYLLPAGSDPDIILHRSTDGGQTWSEGVRVNQDPLNNGRTQYFPGIEVDLTGAVDIIFYDVRNTTADSTGVFLARSTDGGNTWTEYEISDHNFKPAPIGGLGQGYQGDNIDITSANNTLWPVWMDNSTGVYQVWTTPVDISSLGAVEESSVVSRQSSVRVYPNPFLTEATIEYTVPGRSHVTLKIYDMTGNQVAVLVDELQTAGEYKFRIPNSGFRIVRTTLQKEFSPQSVYICVLTCDDDVAKCLIIH